MSAQSAKPSRKPTVRKDPLVGAGLHRKDADGCVQNQATIIDVIHNGESGDLALVGYFDWIMGHPTIRALISLRELAKPEWVFYENVEDMNDHYDRVDEHRNKCIRERLESEKPKAKEWPQLKQPFTNQIMDEVLRNMTDDELEALSAAKPE